MFKIRTTPVAYGTEPYFWGVPSQYQCTWYCYGRAMEAGFTPPCWYDRETQTGSYTNAKEWLKNFRDPWEVKDRDYKPVAGDIAVFDGQYGHVQFLETALMFSEYQSGDPNSFKTGNFAKKSNLLGFLHYPYSEDVHPVPRNENVDQIKTTDDSLRIRTEPNISASVTGHVSQGYYNVFDVKEATEEDKRSVEGLKEWFRLADDRWCANVTTIYLPASDTEIIKQLEEWVRKMTVMLEEKEKENLELKDKLKKIHELSEV